MNNNQDNSQDDAQSNFRDRFNFKVEGFESIVDEVKQLLNFDQLIDLAQKLEEKQQSGEIHTQVNVSCLVFPAEAICPDRRVVPVPMRVVAIQK